MKREEISELLDRVAENPAETAEALRALWTERRGGVPVVAQILSRRPDAALSFLLKVEGIFGEASVLDKKTKELIAVAVAAALRCDYCMQAHVPTALAAGATTDEVMQAMLVAGAICESSSFAHSLRILQRVEDTRKRSPSGGE